MAGLKLSGINKIYPSGTLALYNVSFELSDKEFIAVVGGEKSGKSTLLKVIAGLEEVTEGEIFIDGKNVTQVDVKDREIAMIFRNDTLYPSLNVYDNIAFGLKMRKAPQALIDQRVKSVASILGLDDLLYRKPKALTSEQKQKVAIARAIAREPRLYLLDDPIAGLDDDLKAQMRNVIINLQARVEGTFVYAAKNVNEALTMATRIIVLREGFVQQIDAPANLYDYPANAYVALLIGSPAINFINNATVEKEGEDYAVSFRGGRFTLDKKIVERFAEIEEYAQSGKKVILGIRPEDLTAAKGEGLFKATVTAADEACGENYVDCEITKDFSLIAKSEGLKKDDDCAIAADLSRLYVFDAETRLTLLSRDEGYEKTGYADADFAPLPYAEEEELKKRLTPKVKDKKKK